TINPEDENAPLLLYLAGEKIKLDLTDPDAPEDSLTSKQRRIVLSKDPFAAAEFSHTLMEAVVRILLGFNSDHEQPLGLLGRVRAYHFNTEEQKRGSLHYHGLIWLANKPSPREFA